MQLSYSFLEIQRVVARLWPAVQTTLEPFVHPIPLNGLTNLQSVTTAYKILSNCDFLLTNIAVSSLIAPSFVTSEVSQQAILQIVDSGSQEKFFWNPVPIINVADVDGYGVSNLLAHPRRIAGNSTLTVTLENPALPDEEVANYEVALHGVNVYAYSGN